MLVDVIEIVFIDGLSVVLLRGTAIGLVVLGRPVEERGGNEETNREHPVYTGLYSRLFRLLISILLHGIEIHRTSYPKLSWQMASLKLDITKISRGPTAFHRGR